MRPTCTIIFEIVIKILGYPCASGQPYTLEYMRGIWTYGLCGL